MHPAKAVGVRCHLAGTLYGPKVIVFGRGPAPFPLWGDLGSELSVHSDAAYRQIILALVIIIITIIIIIIRHEMTLLYRRILT